MAEKHSGRWRYIAAYTLAFGIVALVVFSSFLVAGRSLVWHTDGLTQHIKALSYYGMYLRGILESIASGNGFYAPTFAFSLGYGADVVGTLSYYVVGDPLNLFSVFVPTESTPVLYSALLVARLYLAGLAFSLYVRYTFDPPRMGLLAGALTYVFCGFALYATVRHPYFANPLIYFPLVLLGVERVLRERKHGVFALAIGLSAISNFYFFYMIFILMALYIVMRLVALHHAQGAAGAKAALGEFGRLLGSGAIGVLVACCVFVPTVLYFLQDSRAGVEHELTLFYSAKYYSLLLLNATTTSDPGKWSFASIGIVGLIALGSLFSERKANTELKVATIAFAVMLCIPIVGYVSNGFSYVANRWCWAFCFVGATALSVRWKALTRLTKRQALLLVGLVAVYLAVCIALNWNNMSHVGLIVVAGLWLASAAGIAIASNVNDRRATPATARVASGMLLVVTCCGIALNGIALYSPFGGDYASHFLKVSELPDIYDTEAKAVADLGDEDGFYRYSSSFPCATRNAGTLVGLSSTTYYWSLSNAYAKDFFHKMGIDGSDYKGYCWHDLNGQSMLAELVGTKYFTAEAGSSRPFGYDDKPLAQRVLYDTRNGSTHPFGVFENSRPLPFGFTYDKTIDAAAFEALSPEQRRAVVLQAAVVAGPERATQSGDATAGGSPGTTSNGSGNAAADGSTPRSSAGASAQTAGIEGVSFTSSDVPFDIELGKNVEQDDKVLTVKKKGSKIALNLDDAPKRVELSVQFDGFTFDSSSATDATLPVSFQFAGGSEQKRIISLGMPASVSFEPFRYHTMSPGYSDAAVKRIVIEFPYKGTYSWNDLRVIAQPLDDYDAQVAALSQHVLEDVDLHYLNRETAATTRVPGRISLDAPKTLCTQIPYSLGWHVRVDGRDAELLRVNVMFAGVSLPAGDHEIEFVYETPGGFAGMLLTFAGIALFAAMMVLQRRTARAHGNRAGKHAA